MSKNFRDRLDQRARQAHVNYYGEHLSYNEREALGEDNSLSSDNPLISKELLNPDGDPEIEKIKVGDSTGEVDIDKEGLRLKGDAKQYDDIAFNVFGKKLYSTTGTADFDYDKVCLKFSPSGDITAKADCVFGNEPYAHRFEDGDTVTGDLHIHWLAFNDTDQYEFTIKWRILNNGQGYNDTDWNTAVITTCNGKDLLPFSLETGKDYMMQITKFDDITVKVGISAEFQIWATRTDANSFANKLFVTQIDFHMPVDQMGSIKPFQKYE